MVKRDLTWTPFLSFFYRDLKRIYKVKVQTIFTPLVTQSLYLLIFGVSLGKVIRISENFSYLQFIIPGLIALAVLNQSFQNGSSSIFTMKITGEIIDIKSTVLSVQQVIFAVGLSGLVRAIIVSSLTLCIGELFHSIYEGSWLPIAHIQWLVVFTILGGLCFAMLGLAVGMASKTFDHIGAINGFVIAPLIYLGGVFFDLDKLSAFWQTVSLFNPLFYFVNGIRYSFLGASDVPPMQSLIFTVLSLVIIYFITYFFVSRSSFQKPI